MLTDGESRINLGHLEHLIHQINDNNIKVNIIAINFFDDVQDDEEDPELFESLNENQKKSRTALRELMAECKDNVKVFSAKMAQQIYKQFRKKRVNPTTKYRGSLRITGNLSLDVCVYTKTTTVRLPSLKKYSLVSDFSSDAKQNSIINDRVFYVHDDVDKNPVPEEYKLKAYHYGKNLIPISKTDEDLFKNQEDRCLKAIGFTDNFKVPSNFRKK